MSRLDAKEAATLALLRWAHQVQVGQHPLSDWLTMVEADPGTFLLPIRTEHHGCGIWTIVPGLTMPTRDGATRSAMARAAGTYAVVCTRWDEAARDMLKYLNRGGPFTVIARSEP